MQIKSNGIYFKQTDQKLDGYYEKDKDGNLVHHDYKIPTFWERTKYFAKYGYEMNLETIVTSYFYFRPNSNKVYFGSMLGDAISNAKYLRDKRFIEAPYEYLLEGNNLKFKTSIFQFDLEFSDDGLYFKALAHNSERSLPPDIYTYLDWDKI